MKIIPASCIIPLSLALAFSGGGVCFAQAGAMNAPEDQTAEFAFAAPNELVVASVFPEPTRRAEVLIDETSTYLTEDAGSAAAAEPAPKEMGRASSSKIGFGVKVSTLGVGIEVATPLAGKLNLRGGFNMFRFSHSITDNGIHYDGQLHFQSAEAHLDFYPFGGFHISPGILFYNGNQLIATASVPGGQTFSVGGTTYESDPTTPVTGAGKLNFVKVSPSIMVGVGNLIPRNGRHYSFLFEVGGAYQGSARVALNLAGNVCDTTGTFCRAISSDSTVQANIQSEQVKIRNDVNPYRFFPIISLGVGFNF
jgi:hypothetical protein